MSRFDYVKYNQKAVDAQAALKDSFERMEVLVDDTISDGRAKALVMTKLEEAYMWCGKGIRDDQLKSGEPTSLQEERNNS